MFVLCVERTSDLFSGWQHFRPQKKNRIVQPVDFGQNQKFQVWRQLRRLVHESRVGQNVVGRSVTLKLIRKKSVKSNHPTAWFARLCSDRSLSLLDHFSRLNEGRVCAEFGQGGHSQGFFWKAGVVKGQEGRHEIVVVLSSVQQSEII